MDLAVRLKGEGSCFFGVASSAVISDASMPLLGLNRPNKSFNLPGILDLLPARAGARSAVLVDSEFEADAVEEEEEEEELEFLSSDVLDKGSESVLFDFGKTVAAATD